MKRQLVLGVVAAMWLAAMGCAHGAPPVESRVATTDTAEIGVRLVPQLFSRSGALAFSPDGTLLASATDGGVDIFEVATGLRVQYLTRGSDAGHASVAWSPDARYIAATTFTGSLVVWSVRTGSVLLRESVRCPFRCPVAFTSDGVHLMVTVARAPKPAEESDPWVHWQSPDGVLLVELFKRRAMKRVATGHGSISSMTLARSGAVLAVGHSDGKLRLYKPFRGDLLREIAVSEGAVESVAISPDGTRVAAGSDEGRLGVWSLAQVGPPLLMLDFEGLEVGSVGFSGGSDRVVFTTTDRSRASDGNVGVPTPSVAWRVDVEEQPRPVRLAEDDSSIAVATDPTGHGLVVSADGALRLLDAERGLDTLEFGVPADRFTFSDVNFVSATQLVLDRRPEVLLDLVAGRPGDAKGVSVPRPRRSFCPSARIGWSQSGRYWVGCPTRPDSPLVLEKVGAADQPTWQITGGRAQNDRTYLGSYRRVDVVSPDGSQMVVSLAFEDRGAPGVAIVGGEFGRVTGELRGEHQTEVQAAAFSPDGAHVVTVSTGEAVLWHVDSRAAVRRFGGARDRVQSPAVFSPDGEVLLLGAGGNSASLWDPKTGRRLGMLQGAASGVYSASFSPDRRWIAMGHWDGSTSLWSRQARRLLVTVYTTPDGGWVVTDPSGRYDAANDAAASTLAVVRGLSGIRVGQLKAHFYEPGLMAKALGYEDEPLHAVPNLQVIGFPPLIRRATTSSPDRLSVTVQDRGGGIGDVVLKLNGFWLTGDHEGGSVDLGGGTRELSFDLGDAPHLRPGEPNHYDVGVWNRDGTALSQWAVGTFVAGGEASRVPPRFRAIVVGASDYRGDELDLSYPAKDAHAMADVLRLAATRLFGEAHVDVSVVASGTERPATKRELKRVFEALPAAQPNDVLLVFLAGHAVSRGHGAEAEYFFLTEDAASLERDVDDERQRGRVTVSGAELSAWIDGTGASRVVLVLDTCAAGSVIGDLGAPRSVPVRHRRALERFKDRTGAWILAGSTADKPSYEATQYGQGLLTFALLEAIKSGDGLREGDLLDVSRLFETAAARVPQLAKGIGGVQKPELRVARGGSVDLGLLTTEDRAGIELASERPAFGRSSFQEQSTMRDSKLQLGARVDTALRQVGGSDDGAWVFHDTPGGADHLYQLSGRYSLDSTGAITASVQLSRGERTLIRWTVEGRSTRPDDVVGRILTLVEGWLLNAPE